MSAEAMFKIITLISDNKVNLILNASTLFVIASGFYRVAISPELATSRQGGRSDV
ncbi:MAG: hypothetical protein LUF82_00135 [Clostridia bacterium]|nr:hypothetical protein [Clostridia bacterium]